MLYSSSLLPTANTKVSVTRGNAHPIWFHSRIPRLFGTFPGTQAYEKYLQGIVVI
jgi:hypothetical protein